MQGKFIVLEGLDGTGKTTQAAMLKNKLLEHGIEAALTAEPTDGAIGKFIRQAVSGSHDFSPAALAALFLADRIEHNVKPGGIRDLLSKGTTVICDRYYYSTFAYQGLGDAIENFDWLISQNLDCRDIAVPDICIFLDMEPELCMERINVRRGERGLDIFEDLKTLSEIRGRFKIVLETLAQRQRIEIIDAAGNSQSVHAKIMSYIDSILFNT